MDKSGRGRRTIPRVHKEMLDKHADGPRQEYPPIKGETHTPLPPTPRTQYLPATALVLVHPPGTRIFPTHGRIPQTNSPRNRGIHAKTCLK